MPSAETFHDAGRPPRRSGAANGAAGYVRRRQTRRVTVGSVAIGGGARVSIQSMCNRDPHDADAIIEQTLSVARLGCDIFRLTVPDLEAAKVFARVRKASPIPLVADIHFDWRCALAAIEAGADAVRINPGNIGSRDRIAAVAAAVRAAGIPVRVGVNMGSLEKDLDGKVRSGVMSPAEALAESATRNMEILREEGVEDVVLSAKASDAMDTVETYSILSERTDAPLHAGVTEAGTVLPGAIRSSAALAILLSRGIGDTIRVSLTDRPEQEVRAGLEILRTLRLRPAGPNIVSCPTCGRTKVDLFSVASRTEEALEALYLERLAKGGEAAVARFPKVAVMGCAVNGPGEAKGADVALCGGSGEFVLYVKGKAVCKVSERDAPGKVAEHVVLL